jgi:hypothetical protein
VTVTSPPLSSTFTPVADSTLLTTRPAISPHPLTAKSANANVSASMTRRITFMTAPSIRARKRISLTTRVCHSEAQVRYADRAVRVP